MMKISNYVILFEYDGCYLLYNSKNSSFLELSKDLYNDLSECKLNNTLGLFEDSEILDILKQYEIIVDENDDSVYLDQMILDDYISSFSREDLFITFAPTIFCNLKCPYCYETNKNKEIVSKATCDKIIEFIQRHEGAKHIHFMWYGGEPLLCIDKIEYFLNKIQNLGLELFEHNIVTNATLFKGKAIDVFKRHPLNNIQITLDGLKERHDKVRIRHDGSGTFDAIMANMDVLVDAFPKTNITVRVNTGKHNINDFIEISQMLSQRYHDNKNVSAYPGILVGDNDCGFTSNFFSTAELSDFHSSLIKSQNGSMFPSKSGKGCAACRINGYVIGPLGEIYKCWNDIGFKDREISSVYDDEHGNKQLLHRYLLHSTFRDDKNCLNCKLLPNCFGGCPHHRLKNRFESQEHNLCHHYKLQDQKSLKEALYQYYLLQKRKHVLITS